MKFTRRLNLRGIDLPGLSTFDVMGQSPERSFTGKRVTEITALKYSVVWRATSLIADAVASLPPKAVTEDDKGQLEPADLPPWIRSPSPDKGIKRYDVWHQLMVSVLLWGNGYALLSRRESDSQVNGMLVLDPSRVHCEWDPYKPGYRRYQINGGQWLTSADVFHIQGLTLPGHAVGLSVIRQAREAVALGLTLEEFGSRYFAQGSMAKVVIKVPGKALTTEQATQLVKTYERFHRGAGNWHRPAVLSGPTGTEIENISIPPNDAQFLESREFQALDVARWFGVPPHRVGIISVQSSWGSGLAEENTALVQSTYRRYILGMEAAFTAYSPGGEDAGIKIKLDDAVLLRGTMAEQINMVATAVSKQILTPNEGRKMLGYGPIDGGDELTAAVSKGALVEATEPADEPTALAPAPVPKAGGAAPAPAKPAAKPAPATK